MRKLRNLPVLTALAATLVLALPARSLAGDEGVYGPAAPAGSAFVRVFNATAQTELQGRAGDETFTDIPPYGATEFVFLKPGRHTVSVGTISRSVTLQPRRYYTVATDGRSLRLVDNEGFRNRLKALVLLYNLTDGGALSLRTADGRPVVDQVAPGAAGTREVNAVKVSLALFDGDRKVASVEPVALERGRAFSLFVAGDRAKPLTTWVVN